MAFKGGDEFHCSGDGQRALGVRERHSAFGCQHSAFGQLSTRHSALSIQPATIFGLTVDLSLPGGAGSRRNRSMSRRTEQNRPFICIHNPVWLNAER